MAESSDRRAGGIRHPRGLIAHWHRQAAAAPGEDAVYPCAAIRATASRALRKGRMASNDQRVTLAMAILGPHYGTQEVFETDVRLAREFGLFSTHPRDQARTTNASRRAATWRWRKRGCSAPTTTSSTAITSDDEELKAIADCGATVTATVLVELHGHAPDPLVMRMRALGSMPSIGIDVEPIVTGDMFREIAGGAFRTPAGPRIATTRPKAGPLLSTMPVRSREALEWATIGNAQAMGIDDKVGRLSPGMKADITMLGARDLNIFPVHDPIYTIVEQAGAKNVDTVIVDGVLRKRSGKLLFDEKLLATRMDEMRASALRAMDEANFKAQCRLSGRKDTTMKKTLIRCGWIVSLDDAIGGRRRAGHP